MPRARRLQSNASEPPVGREGGLEVQRITVGRTRYVLTYTRCGPRCTRCSIGGRNWDPDRPGHGPYWYALVEREGRAPIRRYCGRDLEAYLRGDGPERKGRGRKGGPQGAPAAAIATEVERGCIDTLVEGVLAHG